MGMPREQRPHVGLFHSCMPTKSRKLKGQEAKDVICRLCLQLEEDNMSHMQVCPALKEAHDKIEKTFQQHLTAWNVVPVDKLWTTREVKTTSWARQARTLIQENFPQHPTVANRVLQAGPSS